MTSPRQVVSEFIKLGYITPKQINEALATTQISPNIASWFIVLEVQACVITYSLQYITLNILWVCLTLLDLLRFDMFNQLSFTHA